MDDSLYLYIVSGTLATVPVLIWLICLLRKTHRRFLQAVIFFLSIFTVTPVLLIQHFSGYLQNFEFYRYILARMENTTLIFLLLFTFAGAIEEIAKQLIVRAVDKYKNIIQTINESISFSLVAALGFSFGENIYYFYNIQTQLGTDNLLQAVIFRGIFTTCAHLIFSGFFGYYYGIAKFSMHIMEHNRITGEKHSFTRGIADLLDISDCDAYRQLMILKGALIAITMHVVYNFLIEINQLLLVICYILLSAIMLRQLLFKKSGRLVLVEEKGSGRHSTIASKDEAVVLELLAMWFKQKRYVDVIHICQRLLVRDPSNKVVALFKANAMDYLDEEDVYNQILKKIFPDRRKRSLEELAEKKTGKT